MSNAALSPGWAHRLAPAGHPSSVSCGEDGPSIGPVRLLRRTEFGFEPRPMGELDFVLSKAFGAPITTSGMMPGLLDIARALDEKNLALAMIATLHLQLPSLDETQASRAGKAEKLVKAGFNPAERRDECGRWTCGGGAQLTPAQDVLVDPWIGDFPIRPIPIPPLWTLHRRSWTHPIS